MGGALSLWRVQLDEAMEMVLEVMHEEVKALGKEAEISAVEVSA
jgi:hypothetical protein